MTQPEEDQSIKAEEVARQKDSGRASRLSFRNFAEHQLRQELKDKALKQCDAYVRSFAECAEEKGLMVVISCRPHMNEIKACMSIYNGEEAWQKYKEENKDRLERMAKLQK
jgi:hypothetical protein